MPAQLNTIGKSPKGNRKIDFQPGLCYTEYRKSTLYGEVQMTKKKIKSVVNKADPMGLLEMQCPEDEYAPEIERIFARTRKGMTADEIAQVIHAVFLEMFDESIDTKLCDDMAHEMLSPNR